MYGVQRDLPSFYEKHGLPEERRRENMKSFYDELTKYIAKYEGRHDDFIYLAPEWYRLMTNLLDDARLPARLRPLVACSIAYFVMPADVISEELHGPYGYIDDIFLCAFVAREVGKRAGDPDLLAENWRGEGDVLKIIDEVLAKEEEFIGKNRERLLKYTGCAEVLKGLSKGRKR
jgi:uncharacterized membrane protein YkvA (DUF1232 family)